MTDEVKELNEFEEVLREAVDKFKPYEVKVNLISCLLNGIMCFQEIVQRVVQESEQFESVEDLMAKCDALLLAQAEISRMEQDKMNTVEDVRKQIVKATNDAAQVILNLDNELDELEVILLVIVQLQLMYKRNVSANIQFSQTRKSQVGEYFSSN